MRRENENYLIQCRRCGRPAAYCRRVIDRRDGSVWPAYDTGYRHKPAIHVVRRVKQ